MELDVVIPPRSSDALRDVSPGKLILFSHASWDELADEERRRTDAWPLPVRLYPAEAPHVEQFLSGIGGRTHAKGRRDDAG